MSGKSNINFSHLFLGILGGALAGATLGLLYAPYKGSKTRSMLTDYASSQKFIKDFPKMVEKASKGATTALGALPFIH